MKSLTLIAAALAALALTACAEREQTAGARKVDKPASSTAAGAFTEPGWKAGDATSWEAQLASRARRQNEYNRTGPH